MFVRGMYYTILSSVCVVKILLIFSWYISKMYIGIGMVYLVLFTFLLITLEDFGLYFYLHVSRPSDQFELSHVQLYVGMHVAM